MSEENSLLVEDKLLKSSTVVGSMTMLSRILGLMRDVIVARTFGAAAGSDAFFVAFKIPNFLRRLFAEGAFSQAFVPVLSEYRTQRGHAEVKALVDRVAGTLGLTLSGLTILVVIASPVFTIPFAIGFFFNDPAKFWLAADMLRITFPYLILISLTAFAGGILNSYGRFSVPAITPVLLNLSLIGSALLLSTIVDPPIMALAWGVLIAGVLQLIFQFPFLARLKLMPKPVVDRQHEGVKRIMKLMIPALFGVSVTQINLLIDTALASFLQTGSITWLYFSDRLTELPLGVFAIAIATVILPNLSRYHSEEKPEQFTKTLDWAVRLVLLIGIPSAVALIILAEPLIITLFQYGKMTALDVTMTAMSLRAYAVGLIGFMLIKILSTGYFSRQDTGTPVKIGIKAMAANMVLNLLLILPLAHAGLALATSLAALLNAGLLFLGLYQRQLFHWQPGWIVFLLRVVVANVVMVALLFWLANNVNQWLGWFWWERTWHILLLCGVGGLGYFMTLYIVGMRLSDWKHRLN